MNNLTLLFIFFILWPFNSFTKESCKPRSVRYISSGETIELELEICEQKRKQNHFILSKTCLNDSCPILKKIKESKKDFASKFSHSSVGNPGFKLCHVLGGTPQILKFEKDKSWVEADRCVFENGDFIETSHLLSLWLEYRSD